MFALIGNILKYSLLVLVVLVLSHIIEIKGTSISQHVKNSMNWIGGVNPTHEFHQVSHEISNKVASVSTTVSSLKNHNEEAKKALDADITPHDQNQLNRVISSSEHKH